MFSDRLLLFKIIRIAVIYSFGLLDSCSSFGSGHFTFYSKVCFLVKVGSRRVMWQNLVNRIEYEDEFAIQQGERIVEFAPIILAQSTTNTLSMESIATIRISSPGIIFILMDVHRPCSRVAARYRASHQSTNYFNNASDVPFLSSGRFISSELHDKG